MKINIKEYEKYFPQGLKTLLKKQNIQTMEELLSFVNKYMTEEEIKVFLEKIKNNGIFLKEEKVSLFREIPVSNSKREENLFQATVISKNNIGPKQKENIKEENEIFNEIEKEDKTVKVQDKSTKGPSVEEFGKQL